MEDVAIKGPKALGRWRVELSGCFANLLPVAFLVLYKKKPQISR
jgi:hypothetical protein